VRCARDAARAASRAEAGEEVVKDTTVHLEGAWPSSNSGVLVSSVDQTQHASKVAREDTFKRSPGFSRQPSGQ